MKDNKEKILELLDQIRILINNQTESEESSEESMQEDFITFETACEYLGVTSSQMYQFTHRKQIPYYRPTGRRLYFLKSDINAFISSNRIATAAEIEEKAHQATRKNKHRPF